ncbi:ATP-citrate lyase, beta subunit [Nitrospira sp. KM1]|uniref:ATP citrate lyase citrate-binding domain-containing protein n=1 Tax=Nitrospira sp. KM1 TaxID=1936990 RepID=UPI0013A71BB0|nr:ATP citrate lyase citrate-binding domain-containing protein [Nitrospira sp. KM1]BCA55890.1 ATP-citrate lyase, beta subunit [Nitrospira sp. KM1]
MAKVLEGPGMGLMKKWGIAVPNYVVVTSADELAKLGQANDWMKQTKLVAKAHEALGSRFKLGLVKVGLDLNGAVAAAKEMIGRHVGSITVSQVIVSEMIPHKEEYYCAVKSTREGSEVLVANCGGIEVESNWERVKRLTLDVGQSPTADSLEKLAKDAGFTGPLAKKMADFAGKMFTCFDSEDAQYLEVNPVVTRESDGELVALDAVTLLDGDAKFRHPDWNFQFAAEFGRAYSREEMEVMAVDSKIKGSVKFIEIPGGDTAMLPAGGGASVYYSDAVVARGGKLANYAEYSGDPPDWAVEVLTDKVCSLPGIKNIIVGGAIANFTDVKKTFGGIINGFRKAKSEGKLKNVKIWVRRGGPREKEGLDAMRALKDEGFDIHVYDRNTPLTDIVDKALQTK